MKAWLYQGAMWCGDQACEEKLRRKQGSPRRMPFEQEHLSDTCVLRQTRENYGIWGKALK